MFGASFLKILISQDDTNRHLYIVTSDRQSKSSIKQRAIASLSGAIRLKLLSAINLRFT
ncbi:hypothetical protein F7734_23350 [Scytonema sp. UIC 10036]|uniref:hypothetical protein n=1 Tax=Scytonema sp. UIC 10036 TaxID=2304196 RepID=UPI0012DA8BBF|nr:hypothetical protein [Scytonema sp. UIC 10036]MUG95137.1 hypothetical protein [Scytonema sp. UIC 10036]